MYMVYGNAAQSTEIVICAAASDRILVLPQGGLSRIRLSPPGLSHNRAGYHNALQETSESTGTQEALVNRATLRLSAESHRPAPAHVNLT